MSINFSAIQNNVKDVKTFVLSGLTEYVQDYARYEIEKSTDEKTKLIGILVINDETWISTNRVFDLFIKFIIAWNGII